MSDASPITVLIADDHPIFRRGLHQIIDTDSGLKVVAEAPDGKTAIDKIRDLKPAVAVLDVDMPGCDGLEVVRFIEENALPVGVVLLTMYREERFFNAAMEAGVKGYVLKDSAIDEIFAAIRAVVKGENYISPTLSTLLVKRAQSNSRLQKSELEQLSAAERRVLKLVSEAKTNQQIASELFLSIRTVENHRANICLKLNLEGKNALLTYALTNKTAI